MKLIQGECITEMRNLIKDNVKVDMVLTDLPYGTTQCKWDNIIPFEDMWDCLDKLTYDNTPIVLFGQEPFSSYLRLSNIKDYRYDWVWDKERGTNFLNANRMPLPCHENISIFYKKAPKYNPQMRKVGIKYHKPIKGKLTHQVYGDVKERTPYIDDGYRYPLSIIRFNKYKSEANNSKNVHPTQKPVRMLEYLIRTYTDEHDTVLDFTMGSGSTGVACAESNRDFIGIELDKEYFNISKKRIENAVGQQRLI
jgi:site-specific DNA-methyltransferase (adenine-specific)